MSPQRLCVLALLFLSLCIPTRAFGQVLGATLTGVVSDSSGAIVPNATVTIQRAGTNGSSRTVRTNSEGAFTVTNLTPGDYSVTFTATSLKSEVEIVTLNVAQTRSVDARLEPGSVNETVTVQQSAVTIDTESSAQAGTVSGTQVRELELNNRNFEQLVTLQPGVVSGLPDEVGFGLNNNTTISVNGARGSANNWTVDGADISDAGANATLVNVPSVDAIQEFTLERSTYDASFGHSGGGQVLVATKSGNSVFHGDVYEFARNTDFNANTYFGNQTGTPRGIEHYNDYGFTVGGPMYIPKIYNTAKNKGYFFWSEEWRKVSAPTTFSVPAPSQDQLNGLVSGDATAMAPAGCVTYSTATDQSQINPACYSKNAAVYVKNVFALFPANSSGNFVGTYSALNNFRQDLVRVDYDLTTKIHLFGRAIQDDVPQNFPLGLFAANNYPSIVNTGVNAPGQNVVGNLTWTISPALVNEAELVYAQGELKANLSGVANSPSVSGALTNNTAYPDPYGRIPVVSFTGGTITGLSQGAAPYSERNLNRVIFDNLSLSAGKHTARAGVNVQQMLKTENAANGYASFNFNSWQDFLLGNATTYSQPSRDIIPNLHYFNIEGYLQDDWRITKRLTFNLGVRYSYFPTPTDSSGTMNNFDPHMFDPTKAPAIDPTTGDFAAGQGEVPATYTNGIIFPSGNACAQAKLISPGVSCSAFGGRVNPNSALNFGPRVGFAFSPDQRSKIAIRGGFGIFYDRSLNGIWENNAFTDPPLVQTTTVVNTQFDNPLKGSTGVSLGPNPLHSTGNPTFKVPSYFDYNLSVQNEVLKGTLFEVAYVGAQGRNLLGQIDLNQPTLGSRQANPNVNVNAIRPFLGYLYFQSIIPAFTSNYNSLQVSLNHHSSSGLTVGIAYTWSKSLTTNSTDRSTATNDTYNLKRDYGPSSLNQPQTFVANYVYDLPFYKEQSGLIGRALGGWEVSGITTVLSGQSLTVTQAADPFGCVASTTTANGCAPGTYPGGLGIATPNGSISPRPDQIAPVSLNKRQDQWFSTSSFAPATGHFGTSRNGVFLGPGLQNWDLGLIKNLRLDERFRFQLRGEFFNAFNHTNFSTVDTGINDPGYGTVTGTHLPRNLQLGGKLYF